MPADRSEHALLSIGALSAGTGIPVETIRTWERRYGFPVAERKVSGHRVYPLSMVPRLRRVAQAIARGHRAAEVLPASERELDGLLASLPELPAAPARRSPRHLPAEINGFADFADLLEPIRAFDADGLKRALRADWARLGPIEFLERRAAPFLIAVGDAWAEGRLEVRHEHFASAILGDFLGAVRSPLDDRATGPVAALATLPGELHGLGIQMAALVFALAGWRPLVVGVDTPVPQIVSLAREAPLELVALSCVQSRGKGVGAAVRTLRRELPRRIPLVIGGAGAPALARPRQVEVIPDLAELDRWLRARR